MRVVLLAIVLALVAPADALAEDATLVKLRDDSKPAAKPAAKKPVAKKAASKPARAAKRKPVRKKTVAKAKPKKKAEEPEVRLRPMP